MEIIFDEHSDFPSTLFSYLRSYFHFSWLLYLFCICFRGFFYYNGFRRSFCLCGCFCESSNYEIYSFPTHFLSDFIYGHFLEKIGFIDFFEIRWYYSLLRRFSSLHLFIYISALHPNSTNRYFPQLVWEAHAVSNRSDWYMTISILFSDFSYLI